MSTGNKKTATTENLRIGMGYDIHRLEAGRRLVMGGIAINSPTGLRGHSDADVVLHAVADAMLGAAALGDIGEHFPDTDPRWKNADSSLLVVQVRNMIAENDYAVQNIDINIIVQKPRLGPKKEDIRENIAGLLDIGIGQVSVKARTKEGLGPVGTGEAIESTAVVLLKHKSCAD